MTFIVLNLYQQADSKEQLTNSLGKFRIQGRNLVYLDKSTFHSTINGKFVVLCFGTCLGSYNSKQHDMKFASMYFKITNNMTLHRNLQATCKSTEIWRMNKKRILILKYSQINNYRFQTAYKMVWQPYFNTLGPHWSATILNKW